MIQFRAIPAAGLDEALRVILAAPPGRRLADRAQVRAFREYLAASPAGWDAFEALIDAQRQAAMLGISLPGGTAVVMIPSPGAHGVCAQALGALIEWWRARAAPHAFYYEQCLIETDADAKRELLQQLRFERVTRLLYLERQVAFPWSPPPDDPAVRFVSVAQAGEPALTRLLPETYVASLDCPELSGRRPVSAVLASHRATGVFDPALWELAQVDGCYAGCVLLAQVARQPTAEVVYMGVAPAYRGRGLGKLLLRRALELCRQRRLQRLTLVVDERNAPARALYAHFHFGAVAQRDAWLRWTPGARAALVDNVWD